MGNSNNKQSTSSFFENEEEEESWFEWMESRSRRTEINNQNIISPKTGAWPPFQPLAFQADTLIGRQKKSKLIKPAPNLFKEGFVPRKGDYLATSEDLKIDSEETLGHREANNNTTPEKDVWAEGESIYSQISPDFPVGEVNISLKYEKSTNRLQVCILKARNLCCKAPDGRKQDKCGVSCSDLYLMVSLRKGQTILQSFRTSKKKGNTDVLFYENYAFDLTSLKLCDISLRLTAIHCCKHVVNADHAIGYVDTDEKSNEASFGGHWLEVITCSGKKVNKWHTLWS